MTEGERIKFTESVIARMMKAGWIKESARHGAIAYSELTPEGVVAVRLLRRFLAQNEGKLSTLELTAFLTMIAGPGMNFLD